MIKFFCDLNEKELAVITKIHYDHWVRFNPLLDRAKVKNEFKNEYSVCKDKIPLGIAVFNEDELVGFCRLRRTNLKCCPELSPWISGLYVLPQFRGKGYGKILVEEICEIAKKLGTKKMYVWTDQTPEFYTKLGFMFMKHVQKNEGGEALLFFKEL